MLLIFSSLQTHGFRVLFSIATLVKKSQVSPFGLKVFKSTSGGLILLSVCTTNNLEYVYQESNFTVRWILEKLSEFGQGIRRIYRSFGTLIAVVTVLLVVYKLGPNYVAFGYFVLLLFWVTGRQLIGKTRKPLWAPLFIYNVAIFLGHYVLAGFPILEKKLGDVIDLELCLSYISGASFLGHLWDSLLILVVMQLFRYERTQKLQEGSSHNSSHVHAFYGCLALIKRFLILHSGKLLLVAVFYASMSPVGVTGFVYLVLLVGSFLMPKTSKLPAKVFSSYTALVSIAEFLYQMLGERLQMLPYQVHGPFSMWLGFQRFSDGFWGWESGFRSRVLVFATCILQYSAFFWLEELPASLLNSVKIDEPCSLFVPYPRRVSESIHNDHETQPLLDGNPETMEVIPELSFVPDMPTEGIRRSLSLQVKASEGSMHAGHAGLSTTKQKSHGVILLSSSSTKKTRQWSKRAMLALRKERYEAQLRTLRVYAKHFVENCFNLLGVEICMLVLLFASFAVLNVISLVYMTILGLCILLNRQSLRSIWPYIVIISSSILVVEYILYARVPPSWVVPNLIGQHNTRCHACWSDFQTDLDYCSNCWLGIMVDDWQTLIAYFMVFFFCCLKLKSDIRTRRRGDCTFQEVILPPHDKLAWREINYETKGQWTWLDRLRFFFYLHFLDIVLLLVFITGTLEYDVLHLGYLAFALVFFRMRVKILKTRNRIFRYLRLYNIILIVLSMAYQAPYFGDSASNGNSIYDMIGLVKMAYGLDITSQSILIDITIFFVVLIQSSIFCSKEFEQVLRYLEAEEMDAMLEAQEAKAAWKTEQLQHIRYMEDIKQQRRMQVEKMKLEMLNARLGMDALSSEGEHMGRHTSMKFNDPSRRARTGYDPRESLGKDELGSFLDVSQCKAQSLQGDAAHQRRTKSFNDAENTLRDAAPLTLDPTQPLNVGSSKQKAITDELNAPEILEEGSGLVHRTSMKNLVTFPKRGSFAGALKARTSVQMIGDSVAQVQTLGNRALENLAGFLNIEQNESDDTEESSVGETEEAQGEAAIEDDGSNINNAKDEEIIGCTAQKEAFRETLHRLSVLCLFSYYKIRSNIDIVCYFFFLLAFIWEFSLLMLVYAASLFLYALLVNPGPSQTFWLGMLIYTEINILLQYMNQVVIHHTDQRATSSLKEWLERLGIPTTLVSESFAGSVTPLFLVYLTTLVQSSIKARDGEWMSFTFRRHNNSTAFGRASWRVWLPYYAGMCKESITNSVVGFFRYCLALVYGSEAPPHFVQVTMRVKKWPEEGIQPGKIESSFNRLLSAAHQSYCGAQLDEFHHSVSSVRVESIESSQQEEDAVIAVLEVIYVASRRSCPVSHPCMSLTPARDVAWEIQRAKDEGLVEETSFPFPILSVIAGGKREVDFYAYIFGCDLLVFFLVAIFYQSFIKNTPEFLTVYQLEDQFPKEYVFVLMTLFFLIVADRVIYLWSFGIGKVCYYLFNLGLFGYYVTFYGWKMQNKEHGLLLLQIFCLLKGLSFALQAMQIKYGLPHKSALYEQFLTRKVSHVNHICFRLYRALPFLFELRCILDWSCSTTSLTMYDWLKLEDIYASLYIVKCDAKLSREKHQLGGKRGIWAKFFSGICTFLVLICIIWLPMLMYSSGNPTNFANPVLDVRVQININTNSGKFSLYQTSLCGIYSMVDLVEAGGTVDSHLEEYDLRDVQLICCEADSDTLWLISPPTLKTFTNSIQEDFSIITKWEFNRQRPKTKEVALFNNESSNFSVYQDTNGSFIALRIAELYPQYFRITSTGEVRMLEGTTEVVSGNLSLTEGSQSWWTFLRDNNSNSESCGSLSGPFAIAISEEVPQGLIGDTLSKFSITSLYITFVLAVGRFIRLQCADLRMRIPYENLPSCDRLIAICEDVYAARAAGELILEDALFWTLVRIYRSPYALLEYTKED